MDLLLLQQIRSHRFTYDGIEVLVLEISVKMFIFVVHVNDVEVK